MPRAIEDELCVESALLFSTSESSFSPRSSTDSIVLCFTPSASLTRSRATHQDDLRLVELLLHFHDRVGLPRVLILDEVVVDLGEVDARRLGLRLRAGGVGGRLPLLARHAGDEVVEQLVEQREGRPDWVLLRM